MRFPVTRARLARACGAIVASLWCDGAIEASQNLGICEKRETYTTPFKTGADDGVFCRTKILIDIALCDSHAIKIVHE